MAYEIVAEVRKEDNDRFNAYNVVTGSKVVDKIGLALRKRAVNESGYLAKEDGTWSFVPELPENIKNLGEKLVMSEGKEFKTLTVEEIREAVASSYALKPDTLVLDQLNWKFAVRAALRGENILMLGPSGCGKTLTARTLAESLGRPFEKFNMGAMTDARSSLIGNTHYDNSKGTYFAGSKFVKAITTPGTIVLLDELTRISPDAENIMMTILDPDQRYMRIDEDPNTPIIEVAEGVTFVGTANVGVEYTSTRILDRATKDRFSTIVELPVLDRQQEIDLLKLLFPEVNVNYIQAVADVADHTRRNIKSDDPRVDTIISTRSTVKQCELAFDGFKYSEIMEAIVSPMFSPEGGPDSPRSFVKQIIQKYTNLDNEHPLKSENKVKEEKKKKDSKKSTKFDDDADLFDLASDTF